MEQLQHFSHQHPLLFNDKQSNEGGILGYCSGCGELVFGPSFSCVGCCFYLHKECAEAPSQLNHPFHRGHTLTLVATPPYSLGSCTCHFCSKICEKFVYVCSCGLDLHMKCALFTYNIAEKRIGELQHIAHVDPLVSTGNSNTELIKAKCFACLKPLLDSVYLSPDSGFYLHVKCVDLPIEINHHFHQEHSLILQFCSRYVYNSIGKKLPCNDCQIIPRKGLGYCCSICEFALHIECASPPPPIIEDKYHQHPFIRLRRRVPFICDACGSLGKHVSYICSTCDIMVHRYCISLPRILRHPRHFEHHISHTYFLGQDELKSWECRICHLEDVNSNYGSYSCSACDYIVHVKCAIDEYGTYKLDESGIIDENLEENSTLQPYSIIKEIKDGANMVAIEIKHFSHGHSLVLSNDVKDDICCDGCVLSIFTPYYYCLQCNFFLHKHCAEFLRKKHLWFDKHSKLHPLTIGYIFQCEVCKRDTSGFAYYCDKCDSYHCLRCASVSDSPKCEGHEHLLPYYEEFRGLCSACGDSTADTSVFRCKRCDFSLHFDCLTLPLTARHIFDVHHFKLTYQDENDYPEASFCDICEGKRNPNHWFYYCAICDNFAHPKCVLGKYSFIKLGCIYIGDDHQHPLTFVQKIYYYPECHNCGKLCLDLALECCETGCNYIVHWECKRPWA